MNPEALEGERSFPKESVCQSPPHPATTTTTQFVSLINPPREEEEEEGGALSAYALCTPVPPPWEIPISWRLKVKRHCCAFPPYSSVSGWKTEGCCGDGENWRTDGSCAQTPTATPQMERASMLLKDVRSPDVNVSHQIQTFQPPFSKFPTFSKQFCVVSARKHPMLILPPC